MKYIIMCGGSLVLGRENPKPLRRMFNETLVERTIRLLRKNGIMDIAISSMDDRFLQFGVPVLRHENYTGESRKRYRWLHAFYPTEEPVCYLMGDVFYSPAAINKIVNTSTNDIEFFASAAPFDGHYIKRHAEPFAFKVQNVDRFWECVDKTLQYHEQHCFRRDPICWELWQVIKGTPLNEIRTNYTVINDFTCDIDNDEQAIALEREIRFIVCI